LHAAVTRWVAAVDSTVLERQLWSLVVLAMVVDVHTTALGLKGGLTEGNPIMRWAIGFGGIGALALAKTGVLAIGLGLRRQLPQYRLTIPLGLAVPWVAVVAVNVATLS
jgi:hypothetical protein